MDISLKLNKNQLRQLKDALLLLVMKEELYSDNDLQNLIDQVWEEGRKNGN